MVLTLQQLAKSAIDLLSPHLELNLFGYLIYHQSGKDSVPEWLLGLTRNQLGFARAGSNPAAVVLLHGTGVLLSMSVFLFSSSISSKL